MGAGTSAASDGATSLANLTTMHDPFPVVFPSADVSDPGKPTQPPLFGLRVLTALAGSPGASLVPWFDFIIGVDTTFFTPSATVFEHVLAACPPRLSLWVYNCKHQSQRQVTLFPRRDWGGAGLLGVAIQPYRYIGVTNELASVHVTASESPWFEAELDYILAVDEVACTAVEDVVLHNMSKVHVYNAKRDDVRVFVLEKGDDCQVGIEVACGLIHDIPARCRATIGRNGATSDTTQAPLNVRVKTPEGVGTLLARYPDGAAKVRLEDWDLANGAEVVAVLRGENVQLLS